jgi:beta-hexosaminidase Fdl
MIWDFSVWPRITHTNLQTFLICKCSNLYLLNFPFQYNQDEKSSVYVKIDANTFFGARNGLATLQQLIWFDDEEHVLKILNKAIIHDAPKFHYRGLMLDTSRHYFSVEAIKRTLVGMAHSKLNRFHWHITDSQSFPFVSKFYPQLAMYGAYSANEVYTWDDIKELVEFARVRGIQVR